MTAKPVVPRQKARDDIDAALDFYVSEAGAAVSLRFIDALESAFDSISRRPATGSPRYAHELDLPGLRCRPLKRYPFLVFYLERDDHIDVWRVLHAHRDIASWLQEAAP